MIDVPTPSPGESEAMQELSAYLSDMSNEPLEDVYIERIISLAALYAHAARRAAYEQALRPGRN